ncbi:MAG: transposase [Acetatifactor sp.]|nr:transposase [Acetatifactor sp.]
MGLHRGLKALEDAQAAREAADSDFEAAASEAQTGNRPYIPDTLYLFYGYRTDRIKGLVWKGDGWFLPYKWLSESRFQWPRSPRKCIH